MILQPDIHYDIRSSHTCTTNMLVKNAKGHFDKRKNTISKKKKGKEKKLILQYYISEILIDSG